jgi:hypothetical protein
MAARSLFGHLGSSFYFGISCFSIDRRSFARQAPYPYASIESGTREREENISAGVTDVISIGRRQQFNLDNAQDKQAQAFGLPRLGQGNPLTRVVTRASVQVKNPHMPLRIARRSTSPLHPNRTPVSLTEVS